jgi:tetratricopeptide (TPR) repeat protein
MRPSYLAGIIVCSIFSGCANQAGQSPVVLPPSTQNAQAIGAGDDASCDKYKRDLIHSTSILAQSIGKYTQSLSKGNDAVSVSGQDLKNVRLEHLKIEQDTKLYCANRLDHFWLENIYADMIEDLAETGHPADAIPVADECLRKIPDSPSCLAAEAWAYLELGQYQQARSTASRLIALGPQDPRTAAAINNMRALLSVVEFRETFPGQAHNRP